MMPQADGKTFFLGIGAAKSGTSWIYDFLANHNEVQPGPFKEMHVLNSNFDCGIITAVRELPWHRFSGRQWLLANLKKAYFRSDRKRYFAVYDRIFDAGFKATGEISPSYMTVKQEALQIVKEHFSKRGVRTVGLLVLRDPVDRLISEVRYRKRKTNENKFSKNIEACLSDLVAQEAVHHNGFGYTEALLNLQKVFSQEDLFICLYEELFQQSTVDSLCEKIGISSRLGHFSKRVNATISEEIVSDKALSELRVSLDKSYACSEQYFGEERLREHWRYY